MHREKLIMACTCEIAGKVRGKAFPAHDLPTRRITGVGWVPTNTMISCFGPIGDTPFGALDDLILVPDMETEVQIDFGDGQAGEHFILGDIRHTDGTPWECCPRDFLRRALKDLQAAIGWQLYAAFEQEFVYTGVDDVAGAPYSLDAFRRQGLFGEALTSAIRRAGIEPDSFLPEYGSRQYEVTCAPEIGLTAADQAIIVRELARATAHHLGHRAVFAPILDPAGVGNGVHIHFSFLDAKGMPTAYDPSAPYQLSVPAQHFMAGVIHHLPAICAITAPSTISYIRLTPNRWAPTYAYLADRDREASLRICPILDLPGRDPARQFNIEFRPADAAASPYLALGAMIHAGIDGIRRQRPLPAPQVIAQMDEAARRTAGIVPLPRSLDEALDHLENSVAAKSWFGSTYLDAYLRHKRAEIKMLAGCDEAEQCRRYADVY